MADDSQPYDFDVFISHASEDKEDLVRSLAQALLEDGVRVWFDEFTMVIGDRLRRKIDDGLSRSRFGVVVLSPSFFEKHWPQQELDGLATLETDGIDRILPVWHKVGRDEVRQFSPILADRLASDSSKGVGAVVRDIRRAMERTPALAPTPLPRKRGEIRAIVDEQLRPRGLVGDEGTRFGLNDDARQLRTTTHDCSTKCGAAVILSLVPVGDVEELEQGALFRWASSKSHSIFHPLSGSDKRPRGDGLMIREPGEGEELLRYTYVSGNGYVEWGRSLGGCYNDYCVVRLGQLLWATSYLYDFSAEIRSEFDLRSEYVLVVSVLSAKETVLSHLGDGWLEPWDENRSYRPKCLDSSVQFRRSLPFSIGEADRRSLLLELDLYLNRAWGASEARGHDHPQRSKSDVPILSERWKERDPWEGA